MTTQQARRLKPLRLASSIRRPVEPGIAREEKSFAGERLLAFACNRRRLHDSDYELNLGRCGSVSKENAGSLVKKEQSVGGAICANRIIGTFVVWLP
jgi:hypothetical protein